jgi:hypothetical protein
MPRERVLAPTAFLRLARAGLNGTFTATYQLRGLPGGGFTDATVILSQRSAPGRSAYVTDSGEWYYKLVAPSGKGLEWVFDGKSFWDCRRQSSRTAWSCTGPGRFSEYYGSNGYVIATGPFLIGGLEEGIRAVVDGGMAPRTLRAFTSQGHACLRAATLRTTWCLDPSELLYSWSSASPSPMLFLWTSARQVSARFTASRAEFNLPARPRPPFIEFPE